MGAVVINDQHQLHNAKHQYAAVSSSVDKKAKHTSEQSEPTKVVPSSSSSSAPTLTEAMRQINNKYVGVKFNTAQEAIDTIKQELTDHNVLDRVTIDTSECGYSEMVAPYYYEFPYASKVTIKGTSKYSGQ